jgi:hypothetical protein
MIRHFSSEEHERLWRICDGLLAASGARAAVLCDATTGAQQRHPPLTRLRLRLR